jgi:hypothetical protein
MNTQTNAALAAALLMAVSSAVNADSCGGGSQVTGEDLSNLLSGNLVCASRPSQASDPNERWSTIHNVSGVMGEHGRGSTDPAGSYDADVGSWGISGNTVTYDYGGGKQYSYTIWKDAATDDYYFCNAAYNVVAVADGTKVQSIPAATALNPCSW